MNQLMKLAEHPAMSRQTTLAMLKCLPIGKRLHLSNKAYVIRDRDRYIVYCNWMVVIPMTEVFPLGEENTLMQWLEQLGQTFS